MELKNWYKTSFSNTEETIIEAPSNTHAAVISGHLRNKSSTETSTVFIKAYSEDDVLKYSVPYIIEPGELKKLNSKLFIKDSEYITVSTDTSLGDVDAVFFGTEMLMEGITPLHDWRGEWDETLEYFPKNLVLSPNGSVYIADITNTNEFPEDSNPNWTLFVSTLGNWRGEWDSTTQFYKNDVVSKTSESNLYIANNNNLDSEPNESNTDWDVFIDVPPTGSHIQGYSVATTAPSDEETLIWNSSTNQYEPKNINNVDLTQIQGYNISTTAPSDNQVLVWNNATNQYEPQNMSTATTTNATQIRGYDVVLAPPSDKQVLVWNNSEDHYEPQDINPTQIQGFDVATIPPSDNQALVWNSTNSQYEPQDIGSASGGTNATQIQGFDVVLITPSNNQALIWNSSTNQYEPQDIITDDSTIQGYNVATTAPSNDQALIWNSSTNQYEPQSISSDASQIQGFNVATTTPTDDQVLSWNNGTNQYEPKDVGGGGNQSDMEEIAFINALLFG